MHTPAFCTSGSLSWVIKLAVSGTLLSFSSLSVHAEEMPVTPPQPPDILLGPLFNDVQNARLFPDQKTFADAVPNSDPLMILADYRMQKSVQFRFTSLCERQLHVAKRGRKICSAGRTIAA